MYLMIHSILAMSQPQGAQGGGTGSLVSMLIMFGGVILVMYFMMIRPQQKRQKEHQKMMESLKIGDKVLTSSGMHGKITNLSEKTIELQVSDNSRITFERSAISTKIVT